MTKPAEQARIAVLFVCLGNICRSPSAEGVFRRMVAESQLAERIDIDSAGTGDWHVGSAPDRRSCAAASQRGVDLSGLRARTVARPDFERFDYILAMDRDNLAALERLRPKQGRARLGLLMQYASHTGVSEVPDPYYGGEDGFEKVLDLLEEACRGLLAEIRQQLTAVS